MVVTKIAEPRRLFLSVPSREGKGTPLSPSPGPDFIDLRNIESRVSQIPLLLFTIQRRTDYVVMN